MSKLKSAAELLHEIASKVNSPIFGDEFNSLIALCEDAARNGKYYIEVDPDKVKSEVHSLLKDEGFTLGHINYDSGPKTIIYF